MGEQRLARHSCCNQRCGWSEQQHAPAFVGEPDQNSEAKQYTEKAHRSDIVQKGIELEGRAPAQILDVVLEKGLGATAAFLAQHAEKFPLGIELGGVAEPNHHIAGDTMNAHT